MKPPRYAPITVICLLAGAFVLATGCTSDDDDTTTGEPNSTCKAGGGAVAGPADNHCVGSDGEPIQQVIGRCTSGPDVGGGGTTGNVGAGGAAGAQDGHEHGAAGEHATGGATGGEEESTIRYGNRAADDDCKYDVSFTNSCIEVGKPVTVTLMLRERASGSFATGAHPDSPEIYLADDPSHISPSNSIKAPEGALGTYDIGPIVFDRSGRWVIRFHYFETCSDVPADSPHGHAAFYFDVP
ncbi:MAG TPA: hypothetical protein VGQ57_07075 [Polyangiaceae bacterium]|jgi:hypothetical protein|nr:hypothetical protein [Polyangiaceae bacterium]